MRWKQLLLALGSVAIVATAPGDEIVVTGQILSKGEIREQARAFVRGVSATPVSGQFARWREPVCPKTIGIAPENAAIVTEKIREVAKDAGVRVAKAKCKTNLLIVFTDNADPVIADLKKSGGRVFGKFDPVERRLLSESRRPARWWYTTEIEGSDGHKPTGTSSALLTAQIEGGAGGGNGFISNGDTQAMDGYNTSNIGTRIRVKIEQANFIVDANAASGRTLKSVAAYAALVTLARIRMDSVNASEGSILALFSPSETRPADLTPRDKAFLAALYRVPSNRDARQQERQIAVQMAKILLPEE